MQFLQRPGNDRVNKQANIIRKKLAEVGQNALASGLSLDEATISRWKSEGRFDQLGKALEILGLKCVPASYRCVDAAELDHILYWARRGMDAIKSADDLIFEDVE